MSNRASLEEAIDRLYQLPLDQFVAARKAAARDAKGGDAAALRALAKPNLVAWALNRLVWSERPVFERLVAAAARLRSAQADALMGRANDLRAADAEHRAALRDAIASTSRILEGAGHAATPDTVRALTAAFEALPWRDQPGRLVKPPAAPGFDVFAGLPLPSAPAKRGATKRAGGNGTRPAPSLPRPGGARKEPVRHGQPDRTAAKQEEREEREAQRAREAALRAARTRLTEARREAATAAQRLRSSESQVARLRHAEERAQEQLDRARAALREAEEGHRETSGIESRARGELQQAEEALARLQP